MSNTRLNRNWTHKYADEQQMAWTERMFKRAYKSDAVVNQRFRCVYCFERMTMQAATAEHAVPRSRGGTTDRKNIKGACSACNLAKGNGSEAWMRRVLNGPDIPLDDKLMTAAYIRFRINRRADKAEKRI